MPILLLNKLVEIPQKILSILMEQQGFGENLVLKTLEVGNGLWAMELMLSLTLEFSTPGVSRLTMTLSACTSRDGSLS